MTIVLSNNLTCKQKELIVNILFEVQEGMPFVANYYEPIYSLFIENTNQIKLPVKAVGDDIMSYNEKVTKTIKDFVALNQDVLDSILVNRARNKISTSSSSINVIEEYSLRFLKSLSQSEKVYAIGNFNEEESQYLEKIELTSISSYDLIKTELENFFEKLTSKKFELKVEEKPEEKKHILIISEEDVKKAEKEYLETKDDDKARSGGKQSTLNESYYYESLTREVLEEAINGLHWDAGDTPQAA